MIDRIITSLHTVFGMLLLVMVLMLVPGLSGAQTVLDCISQTCTVRSDPAAAGTTGLAECRLYNNGTQIAQHAISSPYTCLWERNFAAGTYSLTARFVATDGQVGPDSNVVAFISRLPLLLAPQNLRILP